MLKDLSISKMGSLFLYVIVLLCLAYLVFAVALFIMQPRFLYSPRRDVVYSPKDMGLEFEDVFFETSDGVRLHGWYVPAKDSKYTVLFCHGNGGNVMHRLDSIEMLCDLGLSCFVFDYRGYGKSQGKPTEEGTYKDVTAAHEWLVDKKGVSSRDMIVLGRSLGGSIAAYLASKVEVRGVVIESAFTSYVDVGRKFYPYMPVKWFARFKYRTIDYIREIHCPVLVVHSRNDEMIPFEFGRQLYEAANEPKEFVEMFGSHNDFFVVSSEVYKNAWRQWLASLDGDTASQEQ